MIIDSLKSLAVDISKLIHDPANARKHQTKNLDAIKNSLNMFGQRKPIVVQKDKNGVLTVRAGNGTMEAAKALGWKQIAATIIEEDNVTATAYAIADNRSGELAEWDNDILEKSLELLGLEYDLDDLGFSDDDMKDLFGESAFVFNPPSENENEKKMVVTVTFDNEDEQQELFIELRDRGFRVKA